MQNSMVNMKTNPCFGVYGIEKSIPQNHHLNGDPRDSFFISHPHTYDGYLYNDEYLYNENITFAIVIYRD